MGLARINFKPLFRLIELFNMEILTKYFAGFTEKQIHQFASLKDLYVEWNQKINVISRKDLDNFYVHHVLHSLSIATQFNFPAGYDIMDLGTGGGFPGIPLAIFFPDVHFHLADSINKKLKVVEAVAGAIDLNIYIKRNFAPLEDRLKSIISIEKKTPIIFEVAKSNLVDSLAKPYIEIAIQIAEGTADFLENDLIIALKEVRFQTAFVIGLF